MAVWFVKSATYAALALLALAACAPIRQPEPRLAMPTWPDLTWQRGRTVAGENLYCLSDAEAVKLGRYRQEIDVLERARREVLK